MFTVQATVATIVTSTINMLLLYPLALAKSLNYYPRGVIYDHEGMRLR